MSKQFETTSGICTGRNGTVDIAAIDVSRLGDDMVRLDCVSASKRMLLNGGFSMDSACARAVARHILSITGGCGCEDDGVGCCKRG